MTAVVFTCSCGLAVCPIPARYVAVLLAGYDVGVPAFSKRPRRKRTIVAADTPPRQPSEFETDRTARNHRHHEL